jgi:7-cyano-7-deazaguanine synthase
MGGSEELEVEPLPLPESDSKRLAVCLVSGGMDSCVTTAIAHEENDELAFLHVSYGQRTQQRERQAFEQIADHYGVKLRLVVSLEQLAAIGGSSLTDQSIAVTAPDLNAMGIPSSYVPFRNAHFLSTAVSWGEVIGCQSIYIGAVAEDSSGYPDCRPEFYEAFQKVLSLGTRPETDILLKTPVIGMKKADIVRLGLQKGAPLELSWSCYQESEKACGNCDSCALRLRAFRQAGAVDPVPYLLDSSRLAY